MRQKNYCPNCKAKSVSLNRDTLVFSCYKCTWTASEAFAELQAANVNAQSDHKMLVMLTRDAHAELCNLARDYGYVRSQVPRGLHNFIEVLSKLTYLDNRPAHIKSTDQWHPGVNKQISHMMRLPLDTRARMAEIASQHGIHPYRAQAPVLNGTARLVNVEAFSYSQTAYIGPTLEAIGQGWLRPSTAPPQAPDDYWSGPIHSSRRHNLLRY